MCRISTHPKTANIVKNQIKETIEQTAQGVVFRLGTITCPCGWSRGIMHLYRCLYCKVYFCMSCAEEHFGQTVEEYHKHQEVNHVQTK